MSTRTEPLTIVLVATRDPRGRLSGRKTVLRTIIRSLTDLGHRVIVAHFGPSETEDPGEGGALVQFAGLPGPRTWETGVQLLAAFVTGRRSLNEGLYASGRARAALRRIADTECADVVITDMIRTAPYGEALGRPWIADIDDLLSLRYRLLAEDRRRAGDLLGYHKAPLLRLALGLMRPFMKLILRREAAILARREVEVARRADLVSTVSPSEARHLAAASGRPVISTPMAISGPDHVRPLSERPNELVFLGGLDYQPNLEAVLSFDRQVLPQLAACGLADVRLDLIGWISAAHRQSLSRKIQLQGYVENLDEALQTYQAMLVPEVLQGGIKTKIVHAALNGTLILSHASALAGMGLEPGVSALVWQRAEELAAHLSRIRHRDRDLALISERARSWALEHFSDAALRAKWAANLAALKPAAAPNGRSASRA